MLVSLFIIGEALDPGAVTRELGGEPHLSGKKGDPVYHTTAKGKKISRPVTQGYWRREVSVPETAGDEALSQLFHGLVGNVAIWKSLNSTWHAGISVIEASSDATPQSIFSKSILAFLEQRELQVSIHRDT